MSFVNDFVSQYGMMILSTILTAVVGYIGVQLKKIFEKKENEDVKKKVVEDCVKAVEQIYKDLNGEEKKEKAIENIVAILNQKGISIAPIEIEVLIESAIATFNDTFNKESEDK